jgi:hypothetical protein
VSERGTERFDRRALLLGAPPVELWPSIDPSHLPAETQREVTVLCQALWDVFADADLSVAAILRQYGLHKETLYRAARRCLDKHPDGSINGFRAALPYFRTKQYERQTLVVPIPYARVGCAGALGQLLKDFPAVEQVIRKAIKTRTSAVKPGGQVRQPILDIHREFVTACREAGITGDRYPFNTSRLGIRSLSAFIRRVIERDFDMAVTHAGGKKARKAASVVEQAPAATRPFEVVEFDGHKMDIRLTIRLIDPFGMEQTLELHRIWILVLIDVFTRAVIGYHIALGTEYNKDDVAAALQAALTPAMPRQYRIPDLVVREGGGFPSSVVPATEFACWDWFRMDGAKSHLAGDTLQRLNQIVGCWTDNGPAATPNDRPYIERFFHLVARHFAHRLPGTVGSSPESIERALGDVKGDVSLRVELPELEDMIHVLISNYNATAHAGVGSKTPLEAMAYCVNSNRMFLRTLPMPIRSNLCLMQEARVLPIKGILKSGSRPHINFAYVKYTSALLSSNAALIGRKVRIYYDVRDIRCVKAFFEDGTELGILTAARPWHITPHSLRVRQEIHRLLAEGKLTLAGNECPVTAWTHYKWRQAKGNKRAANALAKAQCDAMSALPGGTPEQTTIAGDAHVASLPAPDGSATAATPVVVDAVSAEKAPEPPAPPKPKPLQIRRTITF